MHTRTLLLACSFLAPPFLSQRVNVCVGAKAVRQMKDGTHTELSSSTNKGNSSSEQTYTPDIMPPRKIFARKKYARQLRNVELCPMFNQFLFLSVCIYPSVHLSQSSHLSSCSYCTVCYTVKQPPVLYHFHHFPGWVSICFFCYANHDG